MQNQTESTVLVELFSTFFDKLIKDHPDKHALQKNLNDFKNILYNHVNS